MTAISTYSRGKVLECFRIIIAIYLSSDDHTCATYPKHDQAYVTCKRFDVGLLDENVDEEKGRGRGLDSFSLRQAYPKITRKSKGQILRYYT